MNKTVILLFISIIFFDCSNKSSDAGTTKDVSHTSGLKSQTPTQNTRNAFEEILLLQQKVENGELDGIDSIIDQMQSYRLKDSAAQNGLYSIHVNKEQLTDFIKALKTDSLKVSRGFEKKYAFNTTPKSYRPDSKHCPDLMVLTIDEEDNRKFQIMLNKSYYEDDDIGCFESAVIYKFVVGKKGVALNKVDYAG